MKNLGPKNSFAMPDAELSDPLDHLPTSFLRNLRTRFLTKHILREARDERDALYFADTLRMGKPKGQKIA